ncbi:LysR family transcriptional regulator [Ferruginivarius sediminum]|uniref:LysR family transcriptional regulator n=2 Tax=Ferruginivarius sediminum TaxID=2661937 RepID=A0A369T7E4_9PROT|nr:LysR family transcriptional regulator [Ferruginivarius sediminum]
MDLSMRYDFRQINAFCVVAEELHFNRAAERLHVTQPSLSRTIQNLEEAVGVSLLHRTTRKVELTEAGKAFLAECRLGLGHMDRAVEVARSTAQGVTGELRIAYMDFAINGRLPEMLRAFVEAHPSIRLSLTYMTTAWQRQALLEHKIDVGFMIGAFENPHLENRPFDVNQYVVLLPLHHPLANAKTLRLSDLADEPFVLGDRGWSAFRERLFLLCHEAGFFPHIVQEASTSEGIFGLAAAGVGVSVYASCARNIQRRGLVIRPLIDIEDTIPTFAVWDRAPKTKSLARFADFLGAWCEPGYATPAAGTGER